ncbi:OmpA family protein [Acinetobacter sp. SwsAc6]|jgi:outer membrane protein OmpA-like peptidoglycan-associated protein|uniref:OmpA family protein n=1 Tax=Acinetobacter TaxID=469 RepID=UPI000EA28CAE|nr:MULTISPECIES: OmpA family protein [Acinetobacter]NWK74560.1 OmpA family protein [Acinetobacter sp. SwsAc6]RKG48528.1 OmpA family protein [Acinetobacter cumulans]
MSVLKSKMMMLIGCLMTSGAMATEVEPYSKANVQQLKQSINERIATTTSGIERYQLAKAEAWLSYANHEYSERGFTSAGKEAYVQANQLVEPSNINLVTQIISPSQVMRRDLWWQIEYLKQRGALDAEPQALANAEVMLVWAAAEYCELGWRHAREHFISAERQLQKVIYALPEEKPYLNWSEAEVPELSALNGKGCHGVNPDVWPLKPKTSVEPEVIEAALPNVVVENIVHFAVDRAVLNAEGKGVLERIASILAEYPDMSITLKGYTDSRASVAYNIALSQRRIDAVRDYLLEKGVNASRITAEAKGKVELQDDQQIEMAHAKSRRVVVYFNDAETNSITVQPQWRDLQIEH